MKPPSALFHWLCLFLATAVGVRATPVDEIEALLAYVGHLDGATFIRNGSSHTPAEAAAHLRLKWENQRERIATAEDFVRLCGTMSSFSGKTYVIRFADGREEPAAQLLLRQLKVIRRVQNAPAQTKNISRARGTQPCVCRAVG